MNRAPAADRNKGPILEVLLKILTPQFNGKFLEIASGTGQHISYFAKTFAKATFQPTEYDANQLSRYGDSFVGKKCYSFSFRFLNFDFY